MNEHPSLIDRQAFSEALAFVRKTMGLTNLDAWVRATEKNAFTAIGQNKFEMDHLVQVSLRIWTQRGIGIATTTDLSRQGLLAGAEAARELGMITDPGSYEFEPASVLDPVDDISGVDALSSPSYMRDALLTACATAKDRHSEISLPHSETSQSIVQRLYVAGNGQQHYSATTIGRAYFQARTESKTHIPRTAFRQRMVRNYENINHEVLATEAAEQAIFRGRYRKIETGNYPVVFSPHAFLSLLGGFSQMLSGQAVAERQSIISADHLGTQVASTLLTLTDTPLDERNPAPVFFSGEGVRTGPTEIIVKGELRTFLHSRLSSKLLGGKNTGHGSFAAKPANTPYFLSVAPGAGGSFNGATHIYIDRVQALHAGISARQGSFSLPIEGRFVNNGEHTSIEAAVVAGDIRDLLKEIVWIGDEVTAEDNGLCPEIGVSSLKVTGGI